MAKQNRTTLKGYFETGDTPSQAQYTDLIDSKINLSESNTGDITLVGQINLTGNLTASNDISASGGGFFGGDIQLDNNQALIGKKLNNVTMNLAKVNSSGVIFLSDSLTNETYVEGQDIIIGKTSNTSLTTVLSDFKVNKNITGSGNLTIAGNISASNTSTASFGSAILSNLPTTTPTTTGSLWLSGSNAENTSKYLMVFTG
tara:strand:+ start:648 stop:1253 length:606 start_codon:yes stop_codon:yes gene_type:complete